jgi:hypothetical protein
MNFELAESRLKGVATESWRCIDCGVNTAPGLSTRSQIEVLFYLVGTKSISQTFDNKSEVYTVHNKVWKTAGMKPWGGCLCIGCLEQRIGRRLKPQDFVRDHEFNWMPGTPRLIQRRGVDS